MNGSGAHKTSERPRGQRGMYGHCQLNGKIMLPEITNKHLTDSDNNTSYQLNRRGTAVTTTE